jgi:hypothetical protein
VKKLRALTSINLPPGRMFVLPDNPEIEEALVSSGAAEWIEGKPKPVPKANVTKSEDKS